MNYEIYKLTFKTPVHFGKGRLTGTDNVIYADTLFSALCIEALKLYGADGVDKLCSLVKNDGLRISDMFPYSSDTLFIPKPIITLKRDINKQGNSKLKKKFKGLKYIPLEDMEDFLKGNYDPENANDMLFNLGKEHTSAKGSVKIDEDNLPYNVGTYTYSENCGIYFVVAAENEDALVDVSDLMDSLSYTGIGGKVSSGYGKFDYVNGDIPKALRQGLENDAGLYMSLSLSLPTENELPNALDGASYELIKRSGFVASENYTDTPVRKKDLYCFKSGSCFKHGFKGDIYDVASVKGGKHSVYRYAIPLLFRIDGGELIE
jgi:CRISPR-associated protein Csm4